MINNNTEDHCGSSSLSSLESGESWECECYMTKYSTGETAGAKYGFASRLSAALWKGDVATISNIRCECHGLRPGRAGSCYKGPEHLWLWSNIITLESCCHTWARIIICCEAVMVVWVGSGLGGFMRQEAAKGVPLPLLPSLPCRRYLLSPSELLDARSAPSKKPPFLILQLFLPLSLSFPYFRPPLPLPTHSFPLSTASTRHPTQPPHAGSSATIPPMLSTILSPFKFILAFVPSSQVIIFINIDIFIYFLNKYLKKII